MDLNTFLNRLQSFIAHPMIRFIIVPIMYLSYGIAYGAKFGRINYLGTFVLMIFIILLQLLEQFFFINLMKKAILNGIMQQ